MADIDKNFMTTYAKVATHDGDDEPIQIWAKDSNSYGGIGTDKLGIWGSVVLKLFQFPFVLTFLWAARVSPYIICFCFI